MSDEAKVEIVRTCQRCGSTDVSCVWLCPGPGYEYECHGCGGKNVPITRTEIVRSASGDDDE